MLRPSWGGFAGLRLTKGGRWGGRRCVQVAGAMSTSSVQTVSLEGRRRLEGPTAAGTLIQCSYHVSTGY